MLHHFSPEITLCFFCGSLGTRTLEAFTFIFSERNALIAFNHAIISKKQSDFRRWCTPQFLCKQSWKIIVREPHDSKTTLAGKPRKLRSSRHTVILLLGIPSDFASISFSFRHGYFLSWKTASSSAFWCGVKIVLLEYGLDWTGTGSEEQKKEKKLK